MTAFVENAVATITITFDDISQKDKIEDVDPIETEPDKHIVFLVRNNGTKKHKVSIDRDKMQKKQQPPGAPGPDTPIAFELFARHSDHVDPGDIGVIIMRIKDQDDFGGAPAGRHYVYKYTIEASGIDDKDPDIGINN
jgi:hypothetical protein